LLGQSATQPSAADHHESGSRLVSRAPVKSGTEGQSGGPMAYCIMDKQDACIDPRKHDWSAAQSYWYINGQRTIVAQGEIRNIGNKPPATDWSMSISRERSRRSIPTRRAPS